MSTLEQYGTKLDLVDLRAEQQYTDEMERLTRRRRELQRDLLKLSLAMKKCQARLEKVTARVVEAEERWNE